MKRWFGVLASAAAAATLIGSAHAATFTQTIEFDSIAPFGVFTTGDFVTSGWNQAWGFTQESQINEIRVHFESEDSDWIDGVGPLGGETWVEVGFIDDVPSRFAIASVDYDHPNIILGPAQDPWFSHLRSALVDGAVTASLGGFESFPGYTDAFTFTGKSYLTLEVDGTPGAAPVPEPASFALLGLGLAAAGWARSRKAKTNA